MAVKRYAASQDNTVTNAYKSSLLDTQRATGSNMGAADVLEVFSVYGQGSGSSGLSSELSRILIQFPVDSVSSDRAAGTVPASGSVSFYLKLYNARHAFTQPKNFNLVVQAVSSSWEEGTGLDMDKYADLTYNNSGSNWIRRGSSGAWSAPGGDYLLANSYHQYNVSFPDGNEDLEVDISGLVEDWLAGTFDNNGVAIYLTASQEAYFSSSTGANSGTDNAIIHNPTGSTESYYTKKFFARSSEYFFKRPVLEARWDSRTKDDRGEFYISSSLASSADNLNTLYLYNYVRGKLTDIPGVGTGPVWLSVYSGSSSPSGSRLQLPAGGGVASATDTEVTGGWTKTGIYSASFMLTGSLTKAFDVWHYDGTTFATSSFSPQSLNIFNNAPTQEYVTSIVNLKPAYTRNEIGRFRLFIRERNWSPTIYSVASNSIPTKTLVSASYRIFRITDDLTVVPHNTGSNRATYLSYDVSGNYFDFNMSQLQADYAYGIKLAYYNDSIADWVDQPEVFKFRVEKE